MERADDPTASARLRARPHAVYLSGAGGWVGFVVVVATLLIRHNDLSRSADWAIVAWSVLAAACGVVGPLVRWTRTSLEIDGMAVRFTTGLLRRSTAVLDLEQAREVAVEQDALGRWLDYGYLRVVDAAGTTQVFPPVGNAAHLRAAIAVRGRRPRARRDG